MALTFPPSVKPCARRSVTCTRCRVRQGAELHALGEEINALTRQEEDAAAGTFWKRARQEAARQGEAARMEARGVRVGDAACPRFLCRSRAIDRSPCKDANAATDEAKDVQLTRARAEVARADGGQNAHALAARDLRAQDGRAGGSGGRCRRRSSEFAVGANAVVCVAGIRRRRRKGILRACARCMRALQRAGKLTGEFTTVADAFRAPARIRNGV